MNAPQSPLRATLVPTSIAFGLEDDLPSHKHRTIWISDVHLGTPGCKAEFLLDFLKWNDADTIFLVGDILDGWRLRKGWHWPQAHNDVVQKLLRKARRGTRVVYVPGNHDEFARAYVDHAFGGIEVVHEAVHRDIKVSEPALEAVTA
jgi:UDP-2,3-diacylglucosamine pyrophosphatase LpxH